MRTRLRKTIKININGLIDFHTYMVAMKELLIARQAADRGLLIIIFQIEIPLQAHVLGLDKDRLILPFDTIFCIRPINSAADGVWYAQSKYVD